MHAYADQAVNVVISHSKARWNDHTMTKVGIQEAGDNGNCRHTWHDQQQNANVCFVVSTAIQPVTKSGVDR